MSEDPRAGNARKGARNRVPFSATVTEDVDFVAEPLELSNGDFIELLADATASLASRAYRVDDGGWYALWLDADGIEHETEDTAPTERAALILAGCEKISARERA